jgi:hypothetical protein
VVNIVGTFCILLGVLPFVAGYSRLHLPLVAIACLLIGLFWIISQWRRCEWFASFGLFVFGCTAAIGILIGLSPILMAFSVLGSLLAWDLSEFSRRIRGAAPEDYLEQIETRHLLRLALLGGTGLFLILMALFLRIQISFGWMFLLVVVFVLGIKQLTDRIRRSN